jgi:DNA-binding CsgD family transcriptional regulator
MCYKGDSQTQQGFNMATSPKSSHIVQAAQQQSFTRTDIATTKRAFQDLQGQTEKLKEGIFNVAASAPQCSKEAFEEAWEKRDQLNKVQEQMGQLQAQMSDLLPEASTARLSDTERQQIKGLYATGLYTQQQLAEQYGVSQPTIGDIIRS